MRSLVTVLVVVCAVPACAVHHTLRVTGGELHRNLGALRKDGEATVDAIDDRDGREPRTRLERLGADQPLTLDGRPQTLAVLARGCRDTPPFADDAVSQADCPLVKLRERQFVVRSFETRDVKRPVGLTVLLLAGALGGFVLNEARGSDSTVERIGNYGLGGLGGFLAAGAIWMIIDCKGRWGSDDCRD